LSEDLVETLTQINCHITKRKQRDHSGIEAIEQRFTDFA